MKVPFLLQRAAQLFPEQTALLEAHGSMRFDELWDYVQTIARHLQLAGLKEGDRLGIEALPTNEVIALFWAAMARGIIAVALNPRLPETTFNEQLQRLHCRAAFVHSERRLPVDVNSLKLPSWQGEAEKHLSIAGLPEYLPPERPATIIFTSGSTGEPRAVVHAYGNHYFSALGANQNMPLQTEDRWLLSLPLFHVAGIAILFRTALAGATVVLPDRSQNLATNIRRFQPTHLSLVATQLGDLLNEPHFTEELSHIRGILMGGSAMPRALLRQAFAGKWPLVISYGSSEMSSQITATSPGDSWQAWLTSGRLLPYRELFIDRENEIWVRGKTLFSGYWQNGKIMKNTSPEGWFATGDLGKWDAKHRLIVLGRKDRMFISGGENIYPEEIERALENLAFVQKALVVPVPHARYGQRPVAFVLPVNPQQAIDADKIRILLKQTLPTFKLPWYIFPWPEDAPSGLKPSLTWFAQKAEKLVGTF